MNAPVSGDVKRATGSAGEAHDGDVRPDPRKSFWRRALVVTGLLLLVFVVLPGIMVFAYRRHFQIRVDEKLAALRQAGEPTTAAELEAYYRIPDGEEDCTALWLEAVGALDKAKYPAHLPVVGSNGSQEIPPVGQPWQELPEVEALLQEHARSMELMHQAADRGGAARYPTDFRDGYAMLLMHAQALRSGARLLKLEAHARAHRGDAAGVAKSIRTGISLGNSLQREPLLISQLVSIAIRGIMIQTYGELLPHVEFSDADLLMIDAELAKARGARGYSDAMQGERTMLITAMNDPKSLKMLTQQEGIPAIPLRQEDMLFALNQFEMVIKASRESPEQLLIASQASAAQVKDMAGGNVITRVRHMLSLLAMPALEASAGAAVRDEASVQVARTAIAVQRFRLAQGRAPATLDELVPEFLAALPKDPFDGKPLRFKANASGVIVYSIGQNLADDGGLSAADTRTGDIVILVPSRAKQQPAASGSE